MIERLYTWLHDRSSRPEERGEYSAGQWQYRIRSAALDLCASATGRVLEIGCGEGLFLAQLARRYPSLEVHGVDIWSPILAKARQLVERERLSQITLKQSDEAAMPYADEYFDTVVCINVLFNLPTKEDFKRVLQEAVRVCKKDGQIIFDIRNSQNPLLAVKYRMAKYYDASVRERNLPLRTYTVKEVTDFLAQNHCSLVERQPLCFPRNRFSPIFIFKAKRAGS